MQCDLREIWSSSEQCKIAALPHVVRVCAVAKSSLRSRLYVETRGVVGTTGFRIVEIIFSRLRFVLELFG